MNPPLAIHHDFLLLGNHNPPLQSFELEKTKKYDLTQN